MSMVFQRFGLFPHKTVIENVGYGLEVQGQKPEERNKIAMEKNRSCRFNWFRKSISKSIIWRNATTSWFSKGSCYQYRHNADGRSIFSALDPLIRSDMQKQLIEFTR